MAKQQHESGTSVDRAKREGEADHKNLSGSSSSHNALAGSQSSRRHAMRVDDSAASSCYANFCRVTGTPEELILDFGLNSPPMGSVHDVAIKQRLVVNYYTAKRLAAALWETLREHESAFGVLETDVQKRVVGKRAFRAAGSAG